MQRRKQLAKSYRCPNCAASLVFDPDIRKMSCGFCGAAISPDDISSVEAQDGFLLGDSWDEDAACYLCENCGARSITHTNTAATFCAFCGSPSISLAIKGGVQPRRILPFAFGRAEAEKVFLTWCKGNRFLPSDFTSAKQIAKISGIYIPFWLFDYQVWVDCTYLAMMPDHAVSRIMLSNATESVHKMGNLVWRDIPLAGSKCISDELMECIEPFRYDQLGAFDTKYLSGFYAENYDVSAKELQMKVFRRVAKYVKEACQDPELCYRDNSKYYPPTAEYVFLPVWFLKYVHRGKTYTFAVNGQTGAVAGDQPTSIWKVLRFIFGVLLGSIALYGLIAFVLFGGKLF